MSVREELLLEDILDKLESQFSPAPIDLSAVALAIQSMPHPPTAEEIATALALRIRIPQPQDLTPVLAELAVQLKNLSDRPTVVRAGGGGPSRIDLKSATTQHFLDIKRGISDFETRLDYGERADENPVYIGRAAAGTATSAATWVIERLTYDVSDRPTRKEVLSGSWDNRGSL